MSIEYFINRLLDLDPNLQQHLNPLIGKTLSITCDDFPNCTCYLTFDYKHVYLNFSHYAPVITAISATLSGLLTLAIKKQQADIRLCKIKIEGDMQTASDLQNFLFCLDLDWEEALSSYVGDAIAHQAIYQLKQILNYQTNARSSLEQMISEYLQEECKLLPTHCEVQNFMQDVDSLRMDVDRIEARISAHENT